MKTILFVCTGNSCRSVMAKGFLENEFKGRSDIKVISAGTSAPIGVKASRETIEAMVKEGIDVSGHLTQSLTENMIEEADIILAMESRHRDVILNRVPGAEGKVYLLTEYGRPAQERKLVNPDIPDPIGKSAKVHQECLKIIKEGVNRVAKRLTENR